MERALPLSTGVGEVMAPHTLVAALIVSPEGTVTVDPGVLHGRSEFEKRFQWVSQRSLVAEAQAWGVVWVAVELDPADALVRYKGIAVSELLVNAKAGVGYKSLAEHVNRMSEAMRGVVNVARLSMGARAAVKQQLIVMGAELWERASSPFKEAFAV